MWKTLSCCLIGIGKGLAASPLPPHRTDGSSIRQFGSVRQGDDCTLPERPLLMRQLRVPPRCRTSRPAPRRIPSYHSTTADDSSLLFRPSARSRGPPMPSAHFCGAIREECSTRSPGQDTPQISRGQLSYRPCIDPGYIKHSPIVDGGLCCCVLARPGCTTARVRFVSLVPHVRSTLPSDPTSR
jgi:hypothetical protein